MNYSPPLQNIFGKKIVCFCYKVRSIFNPKSMNFVPAIRNSIIKMIYSMINICLYILIAF